MAYGDKLFEDGTEHIDDGEGMAICGYPDKGYHFAKMPGLVVCTTCKNKYQHQQEMLQRWIAGDGIKGSEPIQDDTFRVKDDRTPGLGAFDRDWSGLTIKPKERKR